MFEINSKPKRITIQKKTKSGDWISSLHLEAHRRHFDYEEISHLLKSFSSSENDVQYRVLNEYKKTILSTQSISFCDNLSLSDLITVHNNDVIDVYTKGNNPKIKHIREFQKFIAKNGGIKKWKFYPIDKNDNYLLCGKLTLRNNTEVSVAFH